MVTSCNFEEMTLFLQSGCKTNTLWTFLIISETHHVPPDFEFYVEWYLRRRVVKHHAPLLTATRSDKVIFSIKVKVTRTLIKDSFEYMCIPNVKGTSYSEGVVAKFLT